MGNATRQHFSRWQLTTVALLGAAMAVLSGCHRDQRQVRDRGAAQMFERAPTVRSPEKDRCQLLPVGDSARKACDAHKRGFLLQLRGLSVGDQLCLENLVGDPPDEPGCRSRAAIADTATDRILVEIRNATPESRWFDKVQSQVWFEEGALLNLFLVERGY